MFACPPQLAGTPQHAPAAAAGARRTGCAPARYNRLRRACVVRAEAQPHDAHAAAHHGSKRRAILRASGTATHTLSADAPHLAAFLESFAGHNSCLGLDSFRWERLDRGVYLCHADAYKLLKYEVQPTLELAVTVPPAEGADAAAAEAERKCVIALRSSRLEGSAAVRAQSERFAARAQHVITWRGASLASAVELTVELELFGGALALVPRAAVERPGSLVLQRMVDRNLQPFLSQLERDYHAWAAAGGPDAAHHEPDRGGGAAA